MEANQDLFIRPESSIREAMVSISTNAKGIVLIVDGEGRLINTITDGDIRRAILAGAALDSPVYGLVERKKATGKSVPITARTGTSDAELIQLMTKNELRQIPMVDESDQVVGVALLSELVKDYEQPLTAVVMAGGFGTRMRPLTDNMPKPMLPVGDKPLLELIIDQLRQSGIHQVNLTTHYKGEVIEKHFGNGEEFGVDICYVEEDQPLGTAGALSRIEALDGPLLVVNGDVMATVDFKAMLEFHREEKAAMTVAISQYEVQVPYGVVESEGVSITGITEKPTVRYFVNAGVYMLDKAVCKHIPKEQRYDMTDLIDRLLLDRQNVVGFPIHGDWQDIGQIEDYQRVLAEIDSRSD